MHASQLVLLFENASTKQKNPKKKKEQSKNQKLPMWTQM
jgi:hypothetical protein